MSLLSDLESAEDRTTRAPCGVALILDALSPDDADALRKALAGPRRNITLSTILKANGHAISGNTIGRHRRRECKCPA